MRKQLVRGASVFTAAVVTLGLSATSVSAGGPDGGPSQGGPKHGPDVVAVVKQLADNNNSTHQSSSASVDNRQKNVNWPVSIFTVGSGSGGGGSVYSSCGCDEHPSGGGVTQSNEADNTAKSSVVNGTWQAIEQGASADASSVGGGGEWHYPQPGGQPDNWYHTPDDSSGGCRCDEPGKPEGPGGKPGPKPGDTEATVEQGAGNSNQTHQSSEAGVDNHQKNWNSPISIGTVGSGGGYGGDCGCDDHAAGGVDQSNSAENTAKSVTENGTDQSVSQDADANASSDSGGSGGGDYHSSKPSGGDKPGCGCDGGGQPTGGGDTVATVGQHGSNENSTEQQSSASVDNQQTNVNLPITLFSVGSGNGDVSQGNSADNTAKSGTVNGTDQSVDQTGDASATSTSDGKGGGGDTDAAVEQKASNENSTEQHSEAAVDNQQTNVNAPITLFSVGSNNGDVSQGNSADNTATSATYNETDQSVDQTGDATATSESSGKGGGGDTEAGVAQQAGNANETAQQSSADVSNDQLNVNAPISLFSVGSGNGDVSQTNSASNTAASGTVNGTSQGITQVGSATGGLLGG